MTGFSAGTTVEGETLGNRNQYIDVLCVEFVL